MSHGGADGQVGPGPDEVLVRVPFAGRTWSARAWVCWFIPFTLVMSLGPSLAAGALGGAPGGATTLLLGPVLLVAVVVAIPFSSPTVEITATEVRTRAWGRVWRRVALDDLRSARALSMVSIGPGDRDLLLSDGRRRVTVPAFAQSGLPFHVLLPWLSRPGVELDREVRGWVTWCAQDPAWA